MKRCPPGTLCIENVTLFSILIIIGILMCVLFYCKTTSLREKIIITENNGYSNGYQYPTSYSNGYSSHTHSNHSQLDHSHSDHSHPNHIHSFLFNNNSNMQMENPYTPPLTQPHTNDIRGWPVNVSTRPIINNNYSQQGILTRINGEETILPLMGRQLMSGRDKWQYYTLSDKNAFIKLPISVNGKSCTSEYGCDSLNNGDTVYVEGYDDAFKITHYESSSLNYIPYL